MTEVNVFNESDLAVRIEHRCVVAVFKEICDDHELSCGWLNVVLMEEGEHTTLNNNYLNHYYPTDVITFSFNEEGTVNGEVYINPKMAAENAKTFHTTTENEIDRLIVHGILHLVGHDDGTEKERAQMRKLEDKYLIRFM